VHAVSVKDFKHALDSAHAAFIHASYASSSTPTTLCNSPLALLSPYAAASSVGKPAVPITSLIATRTAATPAATAAAAAAAAAAGSLRGYFQVQNERPGHYWARQFNLDGRNVTMGLVATNVAAYGMQMISPQFTRFCMRVSALLLQNAAEALLVCTKTTNAPQHVVPANGSGSGMIIAVPCCSVSAF
jgi:hypothetical protein